MLLRKEIEISNYDHGAVFKFDSKTLWFWVQNWEYAFWTKHAILGSPPHMHTLSQIYRPNV